MNGMLSEFIKIAFEKVLTDQQLLELDPGKLNLTNNDHRELLDRKISLLSRLRNQPLSDQDRGFQKKLKLQLMLEGGLKVPALVGLGASLGAGLGWGLGLTQRPAIAQALKANRPLALGLLSLAGAGTAFALSKKLQAREGRLSRAYSVLNS